LIFPSAKVSSIPAAAGSGEWSIFLAQDPFAGTKTLTAVCRLE